MLKKEFEIIIKEDGTVDADLHGFEGKSCDGAIDEILDAVGKSIKVIKKKEYFKDKKVKINPSIRRG